LERKRLWNGMGEWLRILKAFWGWIFEGGF
jgi:hypothetical protein